jgi:hypothetical protein
MELFIIGAIVVGGIGWWIWMDRKHEESGHPLQTFTDKLDVNKDGKIDSDDAKAAVEVVKTKVKTSRKKKTEEKPE